MKYILVIILILTGIFLFYRQLQKASVQTEALHGNSEATKIAFKVNGEDTSFFTEVILGDYSESIRGEFGIDKDVHWEQIDNIIRVYFHPQKTYKSDPGHDDNIYWNYVGINAPAWIYGGSGGYINPINIKDKQVNFKGEFRFIDGGYWERRSFTFGATYAYYNSSMSNEKVVAFDNAGYLNKTFDKANFKKGTWWNDLYWGDWWNDSFGTGISDWISFDLDITALNEKVIRENRDLGQDEIKLWGFWLGPEFETGRNITFEVKNLEAIIK